MLAKLLLSRESCLQNVDIVGAFAEHPRFRPRPCVILGAETY